MPGKLISNLDNYVFPVISYMNNMIAAFTKISIEELQYNNGNRSASRYFSVF